MRKGYTIGELARAAGVRSSTVRFYERRGLLTPEGRSEGNYRLYGEESLRRLRFIRSAQAAGFTLADIKLLLRFQDGDVAPCGQVQELIAVRLEQVAAQLGQLQQVDGMLRGWLAVCRKSERSGRCGVLEELGGSDQECCDPEEQKT
jgi:DNA-binding transcriptional MerR regulator